MIFYYAFRNCQRQPRRSLLIILTIALGALGLFLFHGVNNGMLEQYKINTIRAKYGHGQVFRKGFYGKVHEEPSKLWMEDFQKVTEDLLALPEVKAVFPRLSMAALVSNSQKSLNAVGMGINGAEEQKFFERLNIIQGTPLGGDAQKIIIGEGLAKSLKVGVGDSMTVLVTTLSGSMNAIDLEISGIFQTGIRDVDDRFFQMEFSAAQILLDTQSAESIAVALHEESAWPRIEKFAEQSSLNLEAVSFEVLDWIYYGNSVKWLGKQFGVFQSIVLFIVLLGVFTTVSISIMERKNEFGFLRSNGDTRSYIASLLFLESIMLSGAGSVLGIVLSYVVNSTLLVGGLEMPAAPGFTLPFSFKIILVPEQGALVGFYCLGTTLIATTFAAGRTLFTKLSTSLN